MLERYLEDKLIEALLKLGSISVLPVTVIPYWQWYQSSVFSAIFH